MNNLWEMTLLANQAVKKRVEGDGETVRTAANHISGYLNGVVKSKKREFEYD